MPGGLNHGGPPGRGPSWAPNSVLASLFMMVVYMAGIMGGLWLIGTLLGY